LYNAGGFEILTEIFKYNEMQNVKKANVMGGVVGFLKDKKGIKTEKYRKK